ncbi:carbamoyltransferase family protein [Allostreptomyces psammosilenae]|uniref:Carbamoyltransferase n=1 Tax=Allostreptomyces psammosilenae TaxID=1892865 RepID=A0A853A4X1_9ACTN|nr:carbamoyltransferase C-terminal domain-containing protein [Allostreptomyces psammosilenae]NYI05548.1 carbamoyltransferase [Allostreptomyces psammosilenae]
MPVHSAPSVVLGLCAHTHDSAAALLVDGALVGFVEEERLSGIKHTKAFPELAVRWLLDLAGLGPGQVGAVAYNFSAAHYLPEVLGATRFALSSSTRQRALPRAKGFAKVAARTAWRTHDLRRRFPVSAVRPVLHHRAHQAYSFAASEHEEAAVLVVDSLGERQTTTIAQARRDPRGMPVLRPRHALRDPASLGYVYGAVTEHLGWRRGDEEGTVMALAATGDPARFRNLFARALPLVEHGFRVDPAWFPPRVLASGQPRVTARFTGATCAPRCPAEPIGQVHRDLAAALQERTEQVMLHLARSARALTGARHLCLGGGVAANCVAAGRIAESEIFESVFVPPAPGDAGTAIGAAVSVASTSPRSVLSGVRGACYLGPDWDEPVLDTTDWPGLRVSRPTGEPAAFLAAELAAGGVVGLFQGRVEAGPRALGNRSILASPLIPGVVDRLNATVKFREPFRPFAPVVTAERAAEYFTLGQEAPFMSFASHATDRARAEIPAVIHANGTARVQTVTARQNPFLHAVLEEFGARTGVPVLINTSLNTKGRPICGTPRMALECLAGSGLDALLLEGWWVTK